MGGWHMDRKFSIGLIVAILVQGSGGIWYAAKMDSRVNTVEMRQIEVKQTADANRTFQIEQRVRVWSQVNDQGKVVNDLKADIAGINAQLVYITRQLDRLTLLREQDRRVREDTP